MCFSFDLDITVSKVSSAKHFIHCTTFPQVESKLDAERNRALTEAEDNMKKTGESYPQLLNVLELPNFPGRTKFMKGQNSWEDKIPARLVAYLLPI